MLTHSVVAVTILMVGHIVQTIAWSVRWNRPPAC